MPDSSVPAWARHILRTARVAAGSFAVLVGVGDVVNASDVITRAAGPGFVAWWAWISIVSGAVAVVSVVLHRWRWELVASAILVDRGGRVPSCGCGGYVACGHAVFYQDCRSDRVRGEGVGYPASSAEVAS